MAFLERRTADVLLTILFFAVVCAALYSARRIILIFVFAIFFAYLIDPVVKFLQRHSLFFRNLRGPAVVEVYLAFVVLIALLGSDGEVMGRRRSGRLSQVLTWTATAVMAVAAVAFVAELVVA